MGTTSDGQFLVQYAETGSESAFEQLVERYSGLVFGVAMRRTSHRQLAEEATQNVFLILARKADHLRHQPERLPGWLHRTTVLESRNVRRKENKRQRKMEDYQAHQQLENSNEPQVESELQMHLDEAIDALPDADRVIVFLRFFEGRRYKDVGERLGKSEDACQKQLSRALGKLENFLQRKGAVVPSVTVSSLLASELTQAAPAGLAPTITTGVLTGAGTLTKSQLIMHAYQTMLYSKTLIAVGVTSMLVPSVWLLSSQADEPQDPFAAEVTPERGDEAAPQAAEPKRRIIDPFGNQAATSEAPKPPETPALSEADLIRPVRSMQTLLTALTLYAGDHGGIYPNQLEDLVPDSLENKSYLVLNATQKRTVPIHYLSGITDHAKGSTPLVVSPSINGKRVVGYLDGSARWASDDEWQRHLKAALKDNPKAKMLPIPKPTRN